MIFIDFIQGFIIGLSLIIAIGPQNLFVIRQGLIKNYIFIVCLICSLSDSLLIIIGITLSSYLINISSIFVTSLKIIGSLSDTLNQSLNKHRYPPLYPSNNPFQHHPS